MGYFDTVGDPTSATPSSNNYFTSVDNTDPTNAPVVPAQVQEDLTRRQFNLATSDNIGMSPVAKVASWVASTGIDVADTAASSFNLAANRGDVWSLFDNTNLKDYYERNKGLVEGTSALVGSVAALAASDAFILPKLGEALASSTALTSTRLWKWGEGLNAATREAMLQAQVEAASNAKNFSLFGSQAGRAYVGFEMAKGAAYGAGQEAILYSLFNNNDALYTNDLSNNLFWAGLGIAGGGAFGAFGARAVARQFSNSDLIKGIRASSLDTAGASNSLVSPAAENVYVPPDMTINESAKLTEFSVNARMPTPPDAPDSVASKLNDLRKQMDNLASDSLQKINTTGITGVKTVKGEVASIPEIKQFHEDLGADPTLAHGVSQMGIPTTDLKLATDMREEYIKSLRERADAAAGRRADQVTASKLREEATILEGQHGVAYIDKRFVDATDPKAIEVSKYDPTKLEIHKAKDTEVVAASIDGNVIRLDANLSLRKPFATAPIRVQLATIDLSNTLLNRLRGMKPSAEAAKAGIKQGATITVTNPNDWFHLELASEYARRTDGRLVDFNSKAGFNSIEEMRLKSLQLRAKEMLGRFGDQTPITEWDRLSYNMPQATPMERLHDPMSDNFRNWLKAIAATEGDTSQTAFEMFRQLEQARRNSLAIDGLDLMPKRTDTGRWDLSGNMFQFNRDSSGNWMRPILMYHNSAPGVKPISRAGLAEQEAIRKMMVINELLKGPQDGMIKPMVEVLLQSPETRKAMDMLGLSEDQITGTGGGLGQLAGEVLPMSFRSRDSAVMLSAMHVRRIVQRLTNNRIEQLMGRYGLTDALTELTTPVNRPTRALVNQFWSNRGGWDLERETVDLAGGMHGFRLADTEKNRMIMGVDEITEDDLLTNPRTGEPIVLDDKGMEILKGFNGATDEILKERNVIRMSMGLTPIESMGYYIPPHYRPNKWTALTFDEFDRPIHGGMLQADSELELQRLMDKAREEYRAAGNNYSIRTKTSLDNNRDIWDSSAMDWINPGFTGAPRKQKLGTGSLFYVDNNAFENSLDWIRRQVLEQGNDTVRALFAEQIQIAKAHSIVEKAINGAPSATVKAKRTIWDEYLSVIRGTKPAVDESSIVGRVFNSLEKSMDEVFANTPIPGRWVVDLATKMGVPVARLNRTKSYEDLAKALGPYTPYQNAVDYAEQTLRISPPPQLRKLVEKTNWLTASLMLRYLELPQAMLNMAGIIATLPALLVNKQSPITVGFKLADGTSIGIPDVIKIMGQSFMDMTRNDPATMRKWAHMVKMGDTSQPVADLNNMLASIDSHAGWRKVMYGSGNPARDGYVKGRGLDGMLSVATDMSESWSRQWAHFAGLRLAEMHGIVGEAAQHDFAREIANAAIADYSPVNRPELFQSAFGSMIGLFMTYMMNQNLKLFRWMETKQYAAFGTQLALQASMFGTIGTPGIQQIMQLHDMMTGVNNKQEPSALDWLYARFGPFLGNAIAHGGSSMLPFAFYTRGDQSIRLPTMSITNIGAGVSMLYNVGRGITDSVGTLMNGLTPENARIVAETLTRDMPNRVLKGWMEVGLLGGQAIDSSGNIMAETKNWFDVISRVVGLRSTRQQAEINAYYAGKSMMDHSAQMMDRVRQQLRADIRSHGGPQKAMSQIDYLKYFNDYVKAGGSPTYFRTWLQGTMREAGSSRGMNDLVRSLRNPSNWLQAWRYGAYGATQ